MTLEEKITALLRTICPRVYRMTAPIGTEQPYITYQRLGGRSLSFLDSTVPDRRNALVQVNVWGGDPDALIQQVELALRTSPDLQAAPQGESQDAGEPDLNLQGARQDFSIWAAR